jgi:hypothetical protein
MGVARSDNLTNTLAYYFTELFTSVKSFSVQAPGPNAIKLVMV